MPGHPLAMAKGLTALANARRQGRTTASVRGVSKPVTRNPMPATSAAVPGKLVANSSSELTGSSEMTTKYATTQARKIPALRAAIRSRWVRWDGVGGRIERARLGCPHQWHAARESRSCR